MNGLSLSYDDIKAALGFAAKAGRCAYGDEACKKAIKTGRAKAVITGGSAARNTRDRFIRLSEEAGVPYYEAECDIGPVIGRPGCAVAALLDVGFAGMLAKKAAARGAADK